MTWFPSWLPRLPSINFAVPSSVQGRFISFLLKKLFGHLFKPGQLDSSQVDAQIGSGYVQVNDLELDAEAVNAYLSDLSITLHDGTISTVIARIPWPNPLAATLGLTLTSLHLTFHVLASSHHQSQHVDPSESMASMAKSFVHEELTPREEATLWQSLHSEHLRDDDEQSVPGSLDPFLTTTEDDVRHPDVEPAGIPIFATLIERLLAKFEFDAEDITITIVHPGNISVTMSVAQIRYQTNAKRSDTSEGETRSLTIEGFSVAARPFLPTPPPSTHTPYDEIRQPVSPTSSTSSLDEETQFAMSQSLAFLPPRSPSTSVTSSIYESALSLRGLAESRVRNATSDDHGKPYVMLNDWGPFETLLSFGSSPIQIQLLTPSPLQADVSEAHDAQGPSPPLPSDDEIKLSISASVIACALRPWQIRGLVNLADHFSSSPQTSHKELISSRPLLFESAPATPTLRFLSSLHIWGVFILLLPEVPRTSPTAEEAVPLLYYFDSPVVPPQLHHGYVRIHLDTLSGSLSYSHNALDSNHKDLSSSEVITTLSVATGDLAIFAFYYQTPGRDELLPFPLFFTDPHLNSQYPTTHHHPGETKPSDYPQLPTFEILDWMDERCHKYGTKLGFWRSRPQFNRATSFPVNLHKPSSPIRTHKQTPEHDDVRPPPLPHAIEVSVSSRRIVAHQKDKRYSTHTLELNVNIAPVQICVDLEKTLHGSLAFFKQVLHPKQETSDSTCDDEAGECTPPCTPHGLDCLEKDQTKDKFTYTQPALLESEAIVSQRISIHFPVIRLSIRSPSPSSQSNRTGVLVINIHDLAINNAPENVRAKARFPTFNPASPQSPPVDGQLQMRAEFERIMFACSLVHEGTTSSFLSLGPLRYKDSTEVEANTSAVGSDQRLLPLLPCLKVTRSANVPSTSNPSTVALSLDLPSLFVDISKSQLDALQYWADNTTQLIDSVLNTSSSSAKMGIEETGLIGSRFFAKSRSGSTSGLSSAVGEARAETVVKLTITESFVRIRLPRTADSSVVVRPFDITLSDLDALIEFEPEGEQQTVLTLGIMDIAVKNGQPSEVFQTLLCLTSPRSLSTSPRPLVKLRLISLVVPETTIKETRVKATVCGFTYDFYPDITWVTDLGLFAKSPPGTFESVIPSERTTVSVRILDGSIRLFAPNHLGALTAHIGELDFLTNVVGGSSEMLFQVVISELAFLAIDVNMEHARNNINSLKGVRYWKAAGYALLAEIADMDLQYIESIVVPYGKQVHIKRIGLRVHSCADTLAAVTAFASDLASSFERVTEELPEQQPTVVSRDSTNETTLSASVFDVAFKVPEIGPAPDMINDDLPTNQDYLDESFGTAAGLRELRDDDLDEFDVRETDASYLTRDTHIVSKIGGETIKIFQTEGITVVEEYFDTLPPDKSSGSQKDLSRSTLHIQVSNADLTLLLYDGYDWTKTRRTIEEEIKEMRKRLAKIRQLVASGQTQDPSLDEASALLFNSVYIGLEQDVDGLEPQALLDAIDEELRDDIDTISQSSWQSLRPSTSKPQSGMARIRGKRLTRSKAPSMELHMSGLNAEIDQYRSDEPLVSRTLVVVKDLEILDHIKTSTWKKFLTDLRSDSRGNIRETESNMVRIEVSTVRPVPNHPSEEVRLRAKILPLRLYVDQDAVDFLKKFFSFKNPDVNVGATSSQGDAYIQLAEIFPIDLKLDYKPRRVDYRALREGRTIELMNFFHFDGAEMTLRHITLAGVTGWPRLFEMLNDLWTPDVKATQLVDVISGVAPIRSMVNVGSGVADLVLLPIAQYKKDGRIVRGVQKGATAFVKSTAIEAIKLGARLATGTQVILEQAEGVLGGQFDHTITAETLQVPAGDENSGGFYTDEEEVSTDLISRYAQQPGDLKEGMQSAYESLQRNFSSAAQTILAVPMEVYERSSNEGPVRSVIRAVPIAVLKPMIGASEAVSKTLLGLHNALDPNVRHENDAKYKNR